MRTEPSRSAGLLPLVAALVLGGLAVAAAFYFRPYKVSGDPTLLEPSAGVAVERQGLGLAFVPAGGGAELGLAFYVGAKVPAEAYAYLGRALAERGYACVIVDFPLGFALFDPGRIERVAAAWPGVEAWVVGGHSLGGAMAAGWADRRIAKAREAGGAGQGDAAGAPLLPAGLLLAASYPGGGADLSDDALPVLSIAASADGLATPEKVGKARPLLPPGTRSLSVGGGNHAQFGEYGAQPGDGQALLPGPAQRALVVEESLAFLDEIRAARGGSVPTAAVSTGSADSGPGGSP